ncbi:hypothetical protein PIROE2DRAFT_1673, partial [Piromyces sp. E2]
NEKIAEITPSISRNTKSENDKFAINDIVDENDFNDESDYHDDSYNEEDDYSDESYEFDEAETAQEAFEAKYYHNRRTSLANNKSSFTNKISLKKVNTLLANQNIMIVDKNQLSETLNNNNNHLPSARVPTTPHTTPVNLDNQKNNTANKQSSSIDLTAICSNISLNSENENQNKKNESTEPNKELTNNIEEKSKPTLQQNNNENVKKNRKSSKKYDNSKAFEFIMNDAEGYIKSKKANKKRSEASSTRSSSNNASSDQLNKIQLSEPLTQTQMSTATNKGPLQVSIDNKKQVNIHFGSKNNPIKISDKNLAVIINPTSVHESEIQELLVSPSKSRCKNNKPPIPVISSSPYTKNHNKNNRNNNNNNNNNNYNYNGNSKPNSPQKLSSGNNELASPTKTKKNSINKSIIAESPLFVGSYPPLINTNSFTKKRNSKSSPSNQNQNLIDYKYNLLDEYNMKKSASPTDGEKSKNRFLKDESENKEKQPQLSKKERKAIKKLLKNKKLNEEFEVLNSTRQTYVVNNGDDEVYRNIFGGQCDSETDNEKTESKKGHKKNKSVSNQQIIKEEENEEIINSPTKKKGSKKNQKLQQQLLEEEQTETPKKKQNKKAKNIKNGNNDDNDGLSRKHTKKSKHQELELFVEDVNDDDLFGITGKPSSMKNKKNKKSARK